MAFRKPEFEKLIDDYIEPLKEACEEAEAARDDYGDAEDGDDRDLARSNAQDAIADIRRIVGSDDFAALVEKLDE